MKVVNIEDLENLERIESGLNRIPKDKSNQIIIDMRWLTSKLREMFIKVEGE